MPAPASQGATGAGTLQAPARWRAGRGARYDARMGWKKTKFRLTACALTGG